MRISLQLLKWEGIRDSHFKFEVKSIWESHFKFWSENLICPLTLKVEVKFVYALSFQNFKWDIKWSENFTLYFKVGGWIIISFQILEWKGGWKSHIIFWSYRAYENLASKFEARGHTGISLWIFKWEIIWESHFKF